jgi:biotin carboxylase
MCSIRTIPKSTIYSGRRCGNPCIFFIEINNKEAEGMKKMLTIIFLGCRGYGTSYEAIKTAKGLGCYTVLVTEQSRFQLVAADELIYMPDLFDREELLTRLKKLECKGNRIAACLGFIDPYVSYAAQISEELGLGDHSSGALALAENKAAFRNTLKDLESSPFFSVIDKGSDIGELACLHAERFPLILKPAVSNGSKDIILVKSETEMEQALFFLKDKLPVLAEEYLEGAQYLIEVAIYKREVSIVAVIEQEWNESFIITGYAFPAELTADAALSLAASVRDIVQRIGIEQGSCHLEMRCVEGRWKLVEINPRISGGWMNKIIETGTGMNLLKEFLKMHIGETPDFHAPIARRTYARYLTVNTAGRLLHISGIEEALSLDGVRHVLMKAEKGCIVRPARSMGDRFACIIAAGATMQHAKDAARDAAKRLRLYVEPL